MMIIESIIEMLYPLINYVLTVITKITGYTFV